MSRPTLLTAALLLPLALAAAEARAAGPGASFSARIEAGAACVNTDDQLFARGDRGTDDLSGANDRTGTVLPAALFDLRYRAASGTEFYLGTPLETTTVRLTLGVGHSLGRLGTLELAALADPWAQVWDDPYRTVAHRHPTRAPEYGGKLGWQGIAGTGLGLTYTGLRTDVADDDAGDRDRALRRSGWTHEIETGYRLPLGPGRSLTPSFAWTEGGLDGGAEAYRTAEAKLAAQCARPTYVVNAFLGAAATRYREEHPDFAKRRREVSAGGGAVLTLLNLFGQTRLYTNLIASYGVRDANLGFFDARTAVAVATLGYAL